MFVPKTFVPDQAPQVQPQGKFVPKTFVPEQKSAKGFLNNVVKSGANAIGGIASGVANIFNPNKEKNTVYNLARVGVGAAQVLDPTPGNIVSGALVRALPGAGQQLSELGNQEEAARNVGQFYKQRYGGVNNAVNTVYNDPVGAALDASAVLTGAGAVVGGAGKLTGINGITRAGSTISKVGSTVDPIAGAGKLFSYGAGKVASKMAPALEKSSDAIILKGVGKPTKAVSEAAERAKTTPQGITKKYNLFDRSSESAGVAKDAVLEGYDDIALKSGSKIKTGDIVKAFDDEIQKLSSGVGGEVADSDVAKIAELQRRKESLLRSVGATNESTPLFSDTSTVTNFRKKVIDPDTPKSMFGLDAKGSGSAQGVKKSRDILRKSINSTDPRLEQLGLDYGALKELEKYFKESERRTQGKQLFNFTKLGGAGIAGLAAGAPGIIGGFIMEQLVNDPRFIGAASKGLDSGAAFLRSKGIDPKTANAIMKVYGTAKAGSLFSPERTTR